MFERNQPEATWHEQRSNNSSVDLVIDNANSAAERNAEDIAEKTTSGQKTEVGKNIVNIANNNTTGSNSDPHLTPFFQQTLNNAKGGGQSIQDTTRSELESKMNTDLAAIRVHDNEKAYEMNRHVGSEAFTNGSDIFFGKGNYNPGTAEGDKMLTHELVHTQQKKPDNLILRLPGDPPIRYRIKPGDTIQNMALRFHVSTDDIWRLNSYFQIRNINPSPDATVQIPLPQGLIITLPLTAQNVPPFDEAMDVMGELEHYSSEYSEAETALSEKQEKYNEQGQLMDQELNLFQSIGRRFQLGRRNNVEKKIKTLEAEGEGNSNKATDLKNKFNKLNQKIIDSYNKQLPDNNQITEDRIKTAGDSGLELWNIKEFYGEPGGKTKENGGTTIAGIIVQKYLGDIPLPEGKFLEKPEPHDIRLILKYMLFDEELNEDDKELIIRFVRKFVNTPEVQNEVFGFEEGMIEPSVYIERMEDPELMSESDRHKMDQKPELSHDQKKKNEEDQKRRINDVWDEFRTKRDTINRNGALSNQERREQIALLRRERKDQIGNIQSEYSDVIRSAELDRTNTELINSLKKVNRDHEIDENKEEKRPGPEKKDSKISAPRNSFERFSLDLLEELSLKDEEEEDKIGEINKVEEENFGLELYSLFQIYPSKYKEAFDLQEQIGDPANAASQNSLYFTQYLLLYGNNEELSKEVFDGKYFTSSQEGDFIAAINNGEIDPHKIALEYFNDEYAEGNELRDPSGVYGELALQFASAAAKVIYNETKLKHIIDYFKKKYLEPLLTPSNISILAGVIVAADVIAGLTTGDYTWAGILRHIKFDETINLGKSKFGTFDNSLDLLINNKFNPFGMNTSSERFYDFKKESSYNLNVGIVSTQINQKKAALVKKIIYEAMLRGDILLGNAGNTNPINQVDQIISNLGEYSFADLEQLATNPSNFVSTLVNPKIQKASTETVLDFRQELAAKIDFHKSSYTVSAVVGEYNVTSSNPEYSFNPSIKGEGKFNIAPGSKINWEFGAGGMFMTNEKPVVDIDGSLKYSQRFRVRQSGFTLYVSASGKYSTEEKSKLGFNFGGLFPLGKDFLLGTEFILKQDYLGHFLTPAEPYMGFKIYLKRN